MIRKILLLWFVCLIVGCSVAAFAQEEVPSVTPLQAYHMMKTRPNTYLIDVRTRYEYQVIGHPVGAYNFPYKFFVPEFGIKGKNAKKTGYKKVKNPYFIAELKKKFKPTDTLLIICRSGHRSKHAVKELLADGYFKKVYNVLGGFEGGKFYGKTAQEKELLKLYSPYYGKRGKSNGWKYYGLPWTYKIDPHFVYPPDIKALQPDLKKRRQLRKRNR